MNKVYSVENQHNPTNIVIAGAVSETVSRYGSAGAEFLKGLRGIDNETGQVFDRSLKQISQGKLNTEYYEQNLKQQAGYSAEVASVSRRNAQNIIDGKSNRYLRSEDIARYGKNHKVVDIVELMDGNELSTSQMKFVSDYENLLNKIARGKNGGKNDLSRYMEADKLELPTEQVEKAKMYCRVQSEELKKQAKRAREAGKLETAKQLERESQNFQKLEAKISDSGMTTKQAIAYRLNPNWETIKDIARVSHKAGVQGAKFGVAVGGSISLVTSMIAYRSGDKEFGEALIDVGANTIKAAGVGYGTAFAGTAIKSYMQQSAHGAVRNLSSTALPTMIVSSCLAAGKSITRYAKGEINETILIQEIGVSVTGTLSSAVFATLGQVVIPIPVLGGIIGGMVGYVLTNTFYQSFFDVLKDAKLAKERRILIEMQCDVAKVLANHYRIALQNIFEQKSIKLDVHTRNLLATFSNENISTDEFCQNINDFAQFLGKDLSIKSMQELDDIMSSNNPLII